MYYEEDILCMHFIPHKHIMHTINAHTWPEQLKNSRGFWRPCLDRAQPIPVDQ